jgi:hypothetical protein
VTGNEIPEFWCRETCDGLLFFFANPLASNLAYPLGYGFSESGEARELEAGIRCGGKKYSISLPFEPFQSLLLRIDHKGNVEFTNIHYSPLAEVN